MTDKPTHRAEAVIAMGSNIPPRRRHLAAALAEIARLQDTSLLKRSFIYETDPVGGPPQGKYLNAAVSIRTGMEPPVLLHHLHQVEIRLGRDRKIPLGPRTIDLDIIFYEDRILHDPSLEIPHPRFAERGFVLFPLSDIIPCFEDPLSKRTVSDLLKAWIDGGGQFLQPLDRL